MSSDAKYQSLLYLFMGFYSFRTQTSILLKNNNNKQYKRVLWMIILLHETYTLTLYQHLVPRIKFTTGLFMTFK